jgi:aarF domain-containing kinase
MHLHHHHHRHHHQVVPELSGERIITSELIKGVQIDRLIRLPPDVIDQHTRDRVGITLLDLCLHELFVWRFMQTDPNWGNFLYNVESETVNPNLILPFSI